jgi:tetratricopeptide (TPR) repeat protein
MKLLAIASTIVLGISLAQAPTAVGSENDDPTQLGEYQELVNKNIFPTISSVQSAKEKATAAFNSNDCENAIEALDTWLETSNWLSNLVSQGLEPFYSASYDDRENFSYDKLDKLVPLENLANEQRTDRNHALVMKAECLAKLNRDVEAVATYGRALELIDVEDWEWWTRAANGLYELIGVQKIE